MTTKREQELLEANHRLLMRARAAEEKLTQAPEEAKKHLEAIRLITMLKDATGVLIHAAGQPGKNLEYEINSLLVSLAGKFERFIGLPKNQEEARTLVAVGMAYLNGSHRDIDEEEMVTIPRSEITLAEREAFKAGWRTNAVSHETQPADYLDGCEQTDFEAYQDLGITIYLDQLQPIKAEFGTEEDPKTWADRWASKVEHLSQQSADTGVVVQGEGLDQPEQIDPINAPRGTVTIKIDPSKVISSVMDPGTMTFQGDLGPSHLKFGPVTIDLKTGKVELEDDMWSDDASRIFWHGVETHILHTRKPPRRVHHLKRGTTYEVIGNAEGQIAVPELVRRESDGMLLDNARILVEGDMLTIYRAEEDGKLYWRVPEEFEDGRFEDLP